MILTYLEAIRQGLWEEMESDPRVFLLGEDIGAYGGAFKVTAGMQERFGERRVMDTPISESAIVGVAIGSALYGMRPVAEMQFIDFIACAFNMISNYAAKAHYCWGAAIPIVIRGPYGGGVHAGPFHSQCVESYFLNTPGLKIVAPSTAIDAKGLIKAAVRDPNPVIYFEHKFLYRRIKEEIPPGDLNVPIGQAVIRREGKHLTIVTYSAMVHVAMEAAQILSRMGSKRKCWICEHFPLSTKPRFCRVSGKQTKSYCFMSLLVLVALVANWLLSLPKKHSNTWMLRSFALQRSIPRFRSARLWKNIFFRMQTRWYPHRRS